MDFEPPDHEPDPNDPSHWRAWTHKEDPELAARLPRDVVAVRIEGGSPRLSRIGCSPLVPVKALPAILPGDDESRVYPAEELLRTYSPPNC